MEEKNKKDVQTILVVEDDEVANELVNLTLTRRGYKVLTARDGKEGFETYMKHKPDLIITDIWMPEADGVHLVRRVRGTGSTTPILVTTGFGTGSATLSLAQGADAYEPKPLDPEALLETVRRLIGDKHLELESETHTLKEREVIPQSPEMTRSGGVNSSPPSIDVKNLRDFCMYVAHMLKGEFGNIRYHALTLRDSSNAAPDIQEECDIIVRSAEYSQMLLLRLLNYLDIGRPQVTSTTVVDLIRRTESIARPRLPLSVQLKTQITQKAMGRVLAVDVDQLVGVLLELINNAAHALRDRGGTIELCAVYVRGDVAITVKDDGPGFPVELRKKVFLEQLPSGKGMGMGLLLAKKAIDAFGGKLYLQNKPEGGTAFTIRLATVNGEKVS